MADTCRIHRLLFWYWIVVLVVMVSAVQGLAQEIDIDELPWSAERLLTSLDAHAISPTIVADDRGLHVLYQELRTLGNATVNYMFSPDLGKTWTNRQVLSSAYSMGVGTSILSHDGVLHAVWCPTEKGINGLNYRRSYDGGISWAREQVITETERVIYLPKLYQDNGTIYLTWIEKLVLDSDFGERAPDVRDLDIGAKTLRERPRTAIMEETWDCLINLTNSNDGGETWAPKLVIHRVFEDIDRYNFYAENWNLFLNYRTADGDYRRVYSEDGGLVWNSKDIDKEGFGEYEPPTLVKYRSNYFRIGTKLIDNQGVIFLARTDRVAPTVSFTSTRKEYDINHLMVTWEGNDDWSPPSRLKYRYRVDNGDYSSWTELDQVALSDLDDGPVSVFVQAKDEAGNISEAVEYTFTIKMPPETVLLTELPRMVSDPELLLTWTAKDNTTKTEELTFLSSLDDGPWQDMGQTTSTVLRDLADGSHRFSVKAVDRSGNVDPTAAQVDFILDTVPPKTREVELGKWVLGLKRLTCRITASDDRTNPNLLTFSYTIDDGTSSDFVPVPAIPVEGLDDGQHRLYIRARDEAGNVESPPYEMVFTIQIPPVIEIVSGPVKPMPVADFEVACEAEDNTTPPEEIRVSYRIDAEPWSEPLPGLVFRINRPGLSAGLHRLYLKAIDSSGNESLSHPRSNLEFVVDPSSLPSPRDMNVEVQGDNIVRLEWRAPRGIESDEVQYLVYRSSSGGFGWTPEKRKEYLVAGPIRDTVYSERVPHATAVNTGSLLYAVSMINRLGQESPLARMAAVDVGTEGQPQSARIVTAEPETPIGVYFQMAAVFALMLAVIVIAFVFLLRQRVEGEQSDEDEYLYP